MGLVRQKRVAKFNEIFLGKAINIEYGIIEKKGNIESMLTKIENWKRTRNGPPMEWGGGWGGGGDC